MTMLPELIDDILCRLPVKTLSRFKCLSKSYCRKIEDPKFIDRHLRRSIETNTNHNLIASGGSEQVAINMVRSINLNSLDDAIDLECSSPDLEEFSLLFLGSCNGLIAICCYPHKLALWNPSTKEIHILPKLDHCHKSSFVTSYGFGYDAVNDDYKLVAIFNITPAVYMEAAIYSLKSNSWRWIRDLPECYYYFHIQGHGAFANGALYWLSRWTPAVRESCLFVFDLTSEEFSQMSLPKIKDREICLELIIIGECLCINCCDEFQDKIDIWAMEEYEWMEAWTKMFSFQINIPRGDICFVRVIAYSAESGKIILEIEEEGVLFYDVGKQIFGSFELLEDDLPTITHVSSLVSPKAYRVMAIENGN